MTTKKISVLHVIHWPRSGITRLVRDLIPLLKAYGIPGSVLVLFDSSCETSEFDGICYHQSLPSHQSLFRRFAGFKKKLQETSPDVVHVHSTSPLLWTALTRQFRGRVVTTLHNDYPFLSSSSPKALLKRSIFQSALLRTQSPLCCVSPIVMKAAIQAFPKVQSPIVVENGIPTLTDSNTKRRVLGESRNAAEKHIVSIGRLNPQKGFNNLIDAFAILTKIHHDIKLSIVGDGPLMGALKGQTHSLGLDRQISFTGYISDPEQILRSADIYVVSSCYEGFNLTLLEAMRSKVPIVATPTGLAKYGLTHGLHAIITFDVSARSIADSLDKALSGDYDLTSLRQNAERLFRKQYTIGQTAKRYAFVYENLFDRNL